MRILITVGFPRGRGAMQVAETEGAILSELGHEVLLFFPDRMDGRETYQLNTQRVFLADFPVLISHPRSSKNTTFGGLSTDEFDTFHKAIHTGVQYCIEDFKPDLVICHHAWNVTDSIRTFTERLEIPYIVWVHGPEITRYHDWKRYQPMVKRVLQNAALILSPSNSMNQRIIDIGFSSKVLNLGFKSDIFGYRNQPPTRAGVTTYATIGAVHESKGLSVLLQAFREAGPDHQLIWIGSSSDLKQVKSSAPSNISFVGQKSQREIAEIFGKSHYFISASEIESFGLAAIEGMAAGLPCILSDIDAFREIAHPECVFFSQSNSQELTQVLTSSKEPCDRQSIASYAYNNFSWDRHMITLMNHIEQIRTPIHV